MASQGSSVSSTMGAPPGLSARRMAFGGRLTGANAPPVVVTAIPAPSTSAPAPPPPPPPSTATDRPNNEAASHLASRKSQGKAKQTKSASQKSSSNRGKAPAAVVTTNASATVAIAVPHATPVQVEAGVVKVLEEAEDDGTICFLCAETVQYWAVGECDHRTCHVCSVRLRCLYKRTDCTFCKHECPRVIFSADATALFSEYLPAATPFSDTKLGLSFETREQMEDTLALLRFNCPAATCDGILSGWNDLKRHTKHQHGLTLCDFCCSNKKIFTHEHELYNTEEYTEHMGETHPYCSFCRQHFYDADLLYAHCRDRHEECFLCVRNGIRHQYHLNYDKLETHYKSHHFLCPAPDCLAQKFVVFETELDLQAHAVAVHNAAFSGDQRARRDARRIETNFTYEGEGALGGGSGGRGGRASNRGRGGGRVGREEAADFVVQPTFDGQLPLGRRVVPGLGNRRPERLAPQSSTGHDASPHRSGTTTPIAVELAPPTGADALVLERHAALLRRVAEVLVSESKIFSFKLAVRSYRGSEMSAGDLVDNLWNLFDRDTGVTGSVVSSVADLFEEGDKRGNIIRAWQDLRVEQNQFPSLAAIGPTLNGVPIAAPSGSSTRALNSQTMRNQRDPIIWSRVERAAMSSTAPPPRAPVVIRERFPALAATNSVPGMARGVKNNTPWSASNSSTSRPSTPAAGTSAGPSSFDSSAAQARAITNASSSFNEAPRPVASKSRPRQNGFEFPSLPTSTTEADRRARVRQAMTSRMGVGSSSNAVSMITDDDGGSGSTWGVGAGGRSGLSTRSGSPELSYRPPPATSQSGGGDDAGGSGQMKKKKKPQKVSLLAASGRGAN